MQENAEELTQLPIESPIDRFDGLTENLMLLRKEDSFMGGSTTPDLRVRGTDMRFSVFKPGSAEPDHYSPSILCHRLVTTKQGGVSFLASESEIFLRRNELEIGEDTDELEELVVAATEYNLAARRLSPSKARRLGFCEEFVKSRSKFRRISHFLAKTVKIVAN